MKAIRTVVLLLLILVLLAVVFLWAPITPRFITNPQPAQHYDEAIARFAELQARDGDELFPECHSTLLTHGEPVSRTIVLLHGITNCPAQFGVIGEQFYNLGYNVLIPRLPRHGTADPMTPEIAYLTAEELVVAADEAVDIAAGLGEHVTVAGFSTGGTMAAWVGQQRPEVDQTVLLAPFLSPRVYPPWTVRAIGRVLLLMPNQFWWWDAALQEKSLGPRYAYPRYPTHAMAQVVRLSFSVRRDAKQQPPQSARLVVVTNAGPRESVDNTVIAGLVEQWRSWGEAEVVTLELPDTFDLKHNFIDPKNHGQIVDVVEVVHPLVIEQIHQGAQPMDVTHR
jgi:pimeloyl-ACP methyl ester carboxylesterase